MTKGELHFRYRCGNTSPGPLLVRSHPVSDGRWHSVLLEVNSSSLKLTLDQQHPASISLTEPCRMMRSHGALLFAPQSQDSAQDFSQDPRHFIGCLKDLELNREPIIAGDTAESTRSESTRVFGVYQCCNSTGACDNEPCKNGGVCKEDIAGGEEISLAFPKINLILNIT